MNQNGDKNGKNALSRANYVLIDVHSKKEKNLLLKWLVRKGYVLMSEEMYDDEGFNTIGVSLKKEVDSKVGYVSASIIRAHWMFHGAKYYYKAKDFIIEINRKK